MSRTQTQDQVQSDNPMDYEITDAEIERILADVLNPVPEPEKKKLADASREEGFGDLFRKLCGF